MSKGPQKCWACGKNEAEITLDGYCEVLCVPCWGTLSVFEKMVLFKKYTMPWEEEAEATAVAVTALVGVLREIGEKHLGIRFRED